MTVYFDYLAVPTALCSSSFDPTSELFPWLSVKLQDWCNKVGPDYAEMVTTYQDLQASQEAQNGNWSDLYETCAIQVMLKGPDHRNGRLAALGTFPSMTVSFARSSNDYFYFYLSDRILKSASGPDPSPDPAEWPRVNQGYVAYNSTNFGYNSNVFGIRDVFEPQDFNKPKPSYVLYSDTPGSRFFAWNLMMVGSWMTAYIMEMDPQYTNCPDCDLGWFMAKAIGQSTDIIPLFRYQDTLRYQRTTQPGHFPSYNIGSNDFDNGTLMDQAVFRDRFGDYVGTATGSLHCKTTYFDPLWTYEFQGRRYMAWSQDVLLPVT